MIDTKELRRLAQAATPGPWKVDQYLGSLRQFVIHMDVGDKGRGSDVAFTSANFGNDKTIANARLIAAANPAAISELLDRLEAAEKERDALRAKIEALQAEVERLSRYYKNGIDCFANPCERHSGERTPPFAEFFEKYGGQCLICVVDNNKALQAENERLAMALELMVTTHDEGGWPTATIAIARAAIAKSTGE